METSLIITIIVVTVLLTIAAFYHYDTTSGKEAIKALTDFEVSINQYMQLVKEAVDNLKGRYPSEIAGKRRTIGFRQYSELENQQEEPVVAKTVQCTNVVG